MSGPAVYPSIEDWEAQVRSLLPAPSALGDGEAFAQALASPWSLLEQLVEAFATGAADVELAPGWVLDVLGQRVGEPRGGLDDTRYRRIIAGRREALGSLGTSEHVAAVVRALTLCGDDLQIALLVDEATGLAAVWVQARVAFSPAGAWLIRAAAVLRAALPLDAEAVASVYETGALILDGLPPLDAGRFAYTLSME